MVDEAPIGRAGPRPSSGRPSIAGKYFEIAGRRFLPRGVTYGTFRPDERGHPYPTRDRVRADFDAMVVHGFDTVRLYTVPPEWLMDEAADRGLHLLVGTPWEQHVAVLEEPARAATVEREVAELARSCAAHPAVFALAVGNEIPASIVRWTGRRRAEGWLRRLYEAAKSADPDRLVTYVNFPTTEYLDLPFLDFLAYNVYLEATPDFDAYLARLHHRAGDRPLVMAELGLDSRAHGEERQAEVLAGQVRTTLQAGCAGFFVFSWTDEWYRGGRQVTGWRFGLTDEARRPKPALPAVARTAAAHPLPPEGGWPTFSVVVCAYQAADTIAECIQGLGRLRYPAFEVVVVDDGSTDGTAEIVQATLAGLQPREAARLHLRLLRTPNRGLSRARNLGIEAARGEIVAFLDADAWPDPGWLTHLAYSFRRGDYAGVGGPNVAPPDRGAVRAAVAHAPGGPTHILETDRVAEHVPGCNMAFRRTALEDIGGFDARFRVAGDDVDLCWRIQEAGGVIGFSPGAMVWHLPRDGVRTYWRQQVGYGVAEALLEAKWPRKYNTVGHVTWGGRVYGPATVPIPWGRGRIYAGSFGQAPFQQEEASSTLAWELVSMPEWHLFLATLLPVSLLGLAWRPLLLALPLLLVGSGLSVARAVMGARRAHFPGALSRWERLGRRALCGVLHLIQPAARLRGRLLTGLVPWRPRVQVAGFVWPRRRKLSVWREDGDDPVRILEGLEARLAGDGTFVRRDAGWSDWDLEVHGGGLGAARLRSCVEWHGGRRQLLRYAVEPRLRWPALPALAVSASLACLATVAGAPLAAVPFVLAAGAIVFRALRETGRASYALLQGLSESLHAEAEGVPLARPTPSSGPSAPPLADGPRVAVAFGARARSRDLQATG